MINESPSEPLSGCILLASPTLSDGVFDHSAVYLTRHDQDKGSEGYILNQPIGASVGDFLTSKEFADLKSLPIFLGGPVARNQLSFIVLRESCAGSLDCTCQVSAAEAARWVHKPNCRVLAMVGYSGWSAGQLEDELARDAWYTATPQSKLLKTDFDKTLWSTLMEDLSPYHKLIANCPESSRLN